MGLTLFKFLQWALKDASLLQYSACVSAVQGHPMSVILVPIESAYVTSYKVRRSNLGHILQVATFLRRHWLKIVYLHFVLSLSHSAPRSLLEFLGEPQGS